MRRHHDQAVQEVEEVKEAVYGELAEVRGQDVLLHLGLDILPHSERGVEGGVVWSGGTVLRMGGMKDNFDFVSKKYKLPIYDTFLETF